MPSTGILATTCSADAEMILTPIRLASVPRATVMAMLAASISWSIRTSASPFLLNDPMAPAAATCTADPAHNS